MCQLRYLSLLVFCLWGFITPVIACTNPVITTTHTNEACYGATTGTINVTVTSGTPPYTYYWSGPNSFISNAQNLTGLGAGIYTLTVLGGGCGTTIYVSVTQPPDITVSASGFACLGQTMNLNATASGGTGALTYNWSGPNSFTASGPNPVISNVTTALAGAYTVYVTDVALCSKSFTTNVGVFAVPTLSAYATYATCNGGNNGSVSLSVNGAPSYTFAWTGPNGYTNTGQNIASLIAGTYSVVVTANNGCSASASATVLQPAAVSAGISSNSPVCTGSPINLFSFAGGGSAPYTYSWSGPNGFSSTAANPIINNSVVPDSGTYTLTIKDANLCSRTATMKVAVSNGPTLTVTDTDLVCNGVATGAIGLAVTGITAGYTCNWIGPNGFVSSHQNISGIQAGMYFADVSVTGGCIAHINTILAQPTAITAAANASLPVCNGNSLQLTSLGNGGTGALSYSWAGPNGFSAQTQNTTIPAITYAGSGIYTVTVKDGNNCTRPSSVHVLVDSIPVVNTSVTDVLCHGDSTGSAQVNATGGGPFYYYWTGSGSFSAHTQSITGMPAGNYSVIVQGSGGCFAQTNATIHEAPAIVPVIATNSPLCAGGTLRLYGTTTGGTGQLSYTWYGPSNYYSPNQNDSILMATVADSGLYYLAVKDADNCTGSATMPVRVTAAPAIIITATPDSCFGNANGSANISVAGGIAPNNYQWIGPGNFNANTSSINHLAAGTYQVKITGGCQATYLDTVIITQPAVLSATVSIPKICAADTLHLNSLATGGTQPYNYHWSGPQGFSASSANTRRPHADVTDTGTYTLTLQDAHNCSFTAIGNATVYALPVVQLGNDTALCIGSSLLLNAGSGSAYTYHWNTSALTQSITVSQQNNYSVQVTNSNSCSGYDTVFVYFDSLPHLAAIHVAHYVNTDTCSVVNPHFGTTYQWNFGDGTTDAGASLVHSYATKGTYHVTLIGSNACGNDTVTTTIIVDSLTEVPITNGIVADINVYPNPARDYITITGRDIHMNQLIVTDMIGRVVFADNKATNGTYRINTSGFANGTYIVCVYTNEGRVARKISIVR